MREVTGQMIVDAARTYLGVPFRHDGRNRDGIDCVGLVVCSLRDLGIDVTDQLGLGRFDSFETLCQTFELHAERVDGGMLLGDALVFRGRLMDNHVALYAGNGEMVHAYNGSSVGRVVVQPLDESWMARLARVYRLRGAI